MTGRRHAAAAEPVQHPSEHQRSACSVASRQNHHSRRYRPRVAISTVARRAVDIAYTFRRAASHAVAGDQIGGDQPGAGCERPREVAPDRGQRARLARFGRAMHEDRQQQCPDDEQGLAMGEGERRLDGIFVSASIRLTQRFQPPSMTMRRAGHYSEDASEARNTMAPVSSSRLAEGGLA